MPTNTELLLDVPLFSLFDEEDRKGLSQVLEEEKVSAGKTIFSLGDPGDCLYIVRSGKVELSARDNLGAKIIFTVAESGDIFGELALFDTGPRSATATVIEDAQLLVLNHEALQFFIRKKPDAAIDLMAVMAKRIRAADELVRYHRPKNYNEEIEQELSLSQKLANFIAEYSGSISFLFLNAGFFFVWIVLNIGVIPGIHPFDPFPFGLLTMAVSLEAIFLSIFVLLAQNVQSAKDRIRGDIEYEVNLRAELEVAELHEKIDEMNAKILERLQRIEKR